ncbi:hypothetical protein B0F90DRAFT_1669735 [Multifurca ochricompacta]|uniref:TauD/TfdA-like domain-containing protein n=1 Tax=Multifurca ochricompacta TaxID=376703 RepID=A0AAD4LZS4_9AGAM|nr:hypothetical protein B0F90DRAFT_1669735 [Multifurca ochricompacta]
MTPFIEKEAVKADEGPSYPLYLPHFDASEKFPPIEILEFDDPGLRADPKLPHLLVPDVKRSDISPYIGTELRNIQLSQLSKEGLDEISLFIAQRKLVVLRDQDFKDISPERQIEIAGHFGAIHVHTTAPNIKGFPEFHVVYRDTEHDRFRDRGYTGGGRANQIGWHVDRSYEKQPPGVTLFWILEQPDLGGDTLFSSQVEAYNRLSPQFQKRLEGLRAVHSGVPQAERSRAQGRPMRREGIETEHPIVRQHPVTGEKALFVNPGFTKYIVGFRIEESELLLNFLYDHIAKGADFQVRVRYEPGTLVLFDQRVTVHSGIPDYSNNVRRHAVRLTPQAEVPIAA